VDHKKILVVGLHPFEAGKTTLCKALIHGFKEVGVGVVPFKPHAGISYWSQFGTFQRGVREGQLVCSDIVELEEAARSGIPLEVLNPVNRLSRPAADRGLSEEESVFQEFVAERFTYRRGPRRRNVYYLNGTIEFSRFRGMDALLDMLRQKSEEIQFVKDFKELLSAYANNFEKATTSCYRHIKDQPLIIESFNDAAYPFSEADDCDAVLGISSGTILQFETDKYFDAVRLAEGKKSKLQLTVSDVFALSTIKQRSHVQPLGSQELNDPRKLKECYLEIIEELTKNM